MALPKFPITADRIPDLTLIDIQEEHSNAADRIIFVELKKPSAKLYVGRGRISKDLNDAWAESLDSLRLVGIVYSDFVRRVETKLAVRVQNARFRQLKPFC